MHWIPDPMKDKFWLLSWIISHFSGCTRMIVMNSVIFFSDFAISTTNFYSLEKWFFPVKPKCYLLCSLKKYEKNMIARGCADCTASAVLCMKHVKRHDYRVRLKVWLVSSYVNKFFVDMSFVSKQSVCWNKSVVEKTKKAKQKATTLQEEILQL